MNENREKMIDKASPMSEKPVKRVFLLVLDGFGIGEAPDAERFGDVGAHTAKSVFETGTLFIPHLLGMGLGHLEGTEFLPGARASGVVARLTPLSGGKDTTVGHWELMGVIEKEPLPTFPNGFPTELIRAFSARVGRAVLCNRPYSGTAVIRDYGEEHLKTGALIVYTSADSVFQIAAHEAVVPCEELYRISEIAREMLTGALGVGRVIARPFVGTSKDNFKRTSGRRDYSLPPPKKTLLDALACAGRDVIAIGKIEDIFAGQGITEAVHAKDNFDVMAATVACARRDFSGLLIANLCDFDTLYGHRRDPVGYAAALTQFDATLGMLLGMLGRDDVLIVTADHGTDPAFPHGTDHTRECVPFLLHRKGAARNKAGTRAGFTHVAKTVADLLGVQYEVDGEDVSSLAPYLSSRA